MYKERVRVRETSHRHMATKRIALGSHHRAEHRARTTSTASARSDWPQRYRVLHNRVTLAALDLIPADARRARAVSAGHAVEREAAAIFGVTRRARQCDGSGVVERDRGRGYPCEVVVQGAGLRR